MPVGSRFLALARNDAGEQVVLKGLRSQASGEPRALQAWKGRGAVEVLGEPERGVLVLEFLDGADLAQIPDRIVALARDVGALIADLHAAPVPAGLRSYAGRLTAKQLDFSCAPHAAELEALYRRALPAALEVIDAEREVLGHGDLHAGNVICCTDGTLRALDPVGERAPAAYDLLYFAVAARAGDPRELLAELTGGYGRRPDGICALGTALLPSYLAWAAQVNFTSVVEHVTPLCEQLLEQGPRRFWTA